MILCCSNCKKELTSDLYPLNKNSCHYDYVYAFDDNRTRYEVESTSFKENVFLHVKKSKLLYRDTEDGYYKICHLPEIYRVAELSVLVGVIPAFVSGNGCCNYSMGHSLVCSCNKIIGQMYLDCYESSFVDFIAKNVERKYKSHCKK